MLRICFVKQGTAYDARYVNVLADMISRNLASGIQGTFECFTDDPEGISEHINTHPIPAGLEGWWAKMWLFKDGHFDFGDRIVYFDLDTVILGPLDEIVKYSGPFAILRDFFKPYDDMQSAVMAWAAGTLPGIWDYWEGHDRYQPQGGDQQVIQEAAEAIGLKPDFLQDIFPSLFVSYKSGSFKRVPPRGCSVVCFHGQPKPHNCNSTWVEGVWQINGTQAFEIEQFCNTEDKQIEANIRHAMSLPHPWLEPVPENDATAIIVGGAPSLKETYAEISGIEGGVIFATNNTPKFLKENGIGIDYQVLIDAREESASFLATERPRLGYLIGSQCDRAVFDKLTDQAVTVWHPKISGIVELVQNDERPKCIVGGGSTVCLKAIAIAYIMGFRKFHLFGMDSSYSGEAHHAYAQSLNDDDLVVNVQVDDQMFKTTPWMVAQADEFEDLLFELRRLGCVFDISGDGLIPYILRETLKVGGSTAADERASSILSRLPEGPLVGAEIGVFAGDLSSRLLSRGNLTLYMVDSWKGADNSDYGEGSDDFHATLTQEQQNNCMARTVEVTQFAGERAKIVALSSPDAAEVIEDGSLDFVFIDADHSYDGCQRDIALWYPKLKPNGLFSGHDYDHPEFPSWGVKRAVDEFAASNGLSMSFGENMTWFITKPAALEIAA